MKSRLRAMSFLAPVVWVAWLCSSPHPAVALSQERGGVPAQITTPAVGTCQQEGRSGVPERAQNPSPRRVEAPAAEQAESPKQEQVQVPSPQRIEAPAAERVESPRREQVQAPSPQKGEVAAADQIQTKVAADPDRFAVIISGVGGEEVYTKKFTSQALQLYQLLTTRFGFVENNVIVLTENGAPGPEDPPLESDKLSAPPSTLARSDAGEVRKAFARIKPQCRPETLVLVILIGHGSFDGQMAKFNLVGPDMAAKDYGSLLGSLASRHIVFINCSSSSGEFIKPLSGDGRVIITATRSGNEQNITTFADSLIAAFKDPAADTDKNGRLSVLELFNYTSNKIAEYYKQKDLLATEHALLDDNGDGVGHEAGAAGDGAIAAVTFLDPRPSAQATADPELARLLDQRQSLEEQIGKLKSRKAEMKPEDYDAELERLLVELAKVNQSIKGRKK
jgi:hypothetical protein